MLTYHRALDPYHAAIRALRLFTQTPKLRLWGAQLRILDFCLLFPEFILNDVRLSQPMKAAARQIERVDQKYSGLSDAPAAFSKLEATVAQGVYMLLSTGLLVRDNTERETPSFDEQLLLRTDSDLPARLSEIVMSRNKSEQRLISFVTGELVSIPFMGRDGLKHRTGLMEFRYDAI